MAHDETATLNGVASSALLGAGGFEMKLFSIHRNVISGQCKGALLRLQVRYTAIFFFPGLIRGWAGSKIGLFAPSRKDLSKCTAFYFHPWLAPDIAVAQLPRWYTWSMNAISFRIG